MCQIIMRFKSGREYSFKCKTYTIHTSAWGELVSFDYKNGIGECPIFYNTKEVESIAIVIEDKEKTQ